MNKPKYSIGESILNTLGFGDCLLTDIFYSKTSETYVYQICVDGSYFVTTPDELEPNE